MAAHAGRDMLLKIGDGAEPQAFTTMAGLRARTLSLNARPVDITHGESPGRWRELLSGAGVRNASVTGTGVFVDGEAASLVQAVFFDQAVRDWRLVIPGLGTLEGPFLVTALEYSGRHDGEAAWSLSLASAGELSLNEA